MKSMRISRKVLLIGWDAADWMMLHPLLDAGELPHLNRLVEEGVIGNLASLHPCLSPILWTSIATGKTADKHGILGFVEPHPLGGGLRLATSTSRTTKAIWNILSQCDIRSVVIGWFASHPAEPILGVCVSNRLTEDPPANPDDLWPLPDGTVHPPTYSASIADLRLHPGDLHFEEMAAFIPDLASIDLNTDPRPVRLARALAKTASVHNVATALMESEPWDFLAVYYDALDVVGHDFMPYHPPRLPHIPQSDFDRYQGVMTALVRFHDQMLGRLLELAGEDTTVVLVSDHGFHCGGNRPQDTKAGEAPETQAAAWHRPFGVIALHGPDILADERIYGASLLDVAPTVLRLFGLPAGADMDGRVLVDAFACPLEAIAPIPSWDAEPGDQYLHPPDLRQDPYASTAAIQQLVELGYLPTLDHGNAIALAKAEADFNLALVHLHHGRVARAQELLQALHDRDPEHTRFALKLARACFDLGQYDRAQELVARIESRGIRTVDGDLMGIALSLQQGKLDEATARIRSAEQRHPPSANLQYLIGNLLLAQHRWRDAQAVLQRGVELDPDLAPCHNSLAHALLMQGEFSKAGECALRAVGLQFFFPQAHYHLGQAMAALGEPERAIRSLEIAVEQSPQFHDAHRELARLYERTGNSLRALRHRRLADGFPDTG